MSTVPHMNISSDPNVTTSDSEDRILAHAYEYLLFMLIFAWYPRDTVQTIDLGPVVQN